ncbi:flagellar assembly protein FliH [Pseudomonas sp. PDM16]|uniref:flagellar assembly protein FliH n=1 Tax=Pseudomonas sp. PDM16 TaxID=2769292 RepID=UPI00177C2479|nr:flagellar assembly protein FliH [Pseudomonas sp. PDM16]MBD9416521.1 flagellar assembly protein FliH [Pseudomonas sp. PDM16]
MVPKDASSELIRAKDVTGFDRWSLPSFDPEVVLPPEPEVVPPPPEEPEPVQVEEVPVEEVQPLTLDELEAIRQDAYNEGFATGEKDGFHAGQLRAKQEADAALADKVGQLEQIMGHLLEPIASQDQELEKALVSLVSQMARQVIQRELATDSSQIRNVLREALKLLPMGASNVRIHIHPQDFELVKALRERHEESWRILEDDSLQPGGCRVESEHSRIDASVETRMAAALKKLFEQQRAQVGNPPEPDIQVDLESPDAP